MNVRDRQDKTAVPSLTPTGAVQEADRKKEGPLRTNSLDTGVSETLKVTPIRKVLQHISPGRGGIGKLQNVINLHFEGNWMPIMVRHQICTLQACLMDWKEDTERSVRPVVGQMHGMLEA